MDNIKATLSTLSQKIDTIIDYAIFFGIVLVAFLLVGSLVRFLFGKRNQLGKAITSAMEVLFLYLLYLIIYSFGLHWDLFLDPLPFISMVEGSMHIFPIIGASFGTICAHFAKLLLICFLVNFMNSLIPEGKKMWLWLLLRAATVVLVIFANLALDRALNAWLPQGVASIAPIILIVALVLLVVLGSLKLIVGAALFVANPVIGALYTFFFSNLIGQALARSIVSAGLLTALVYLLNSLGILTLTLTAASLILLIPAVLAVILVWYVIDRIV